MTPSRTASGYRTFSLDDVARLRYVLAAQRDRFWPLKVIRDALDALDRGLTEPDDPHQGPSLSSKLGPKPPTPAHDPQVPGGAALRRRGDVSLTGSELREASGIDRDTLVALENFGLVQADQSGHYAGEALEVAAAARSLAVHGLEARHLRSFRTAADREVGLVEQVLATRRDEGSDHERAAEIASACISLHVALVKVGLARR